MKSPEQLADALKQITDLCTENEMPAIFVGTVKANDDVNIITYPGHDTSTDQGIDTVAQQLYLAAVRTPKSHLGTIILNVAAALCVANPEIGKLFMQDLGKKHVQMEFEKMKMKRPSNRTILATTSKSPPRTACPVASTKVAPLTE